jgi:hypothetical protein
VAAVVEKPKRGRKQKLRPRLPDHWPIAELPVREPRLAPLPVHLPDQWPLAEAPQPPAPVQPPAAAAETFEVLAFRSSEPVWTVVQEEPKTVIFSPPQPAPSEPHYASRVERRRFTWESPEMYWEETD